MKRDSNVYLDKLPLCSTTWTEENARVMCRQLGFSTAVIPSNNNIWDNAVDFHKKSFNCSGLEQNILVCPSSMTDGNCTGREAMVQCSGMVYVFSVLYVIN